ncbi:molybdopterin-dependent oxidoreductase [Methylobacterium sp. E-016]|uniref:molybdopterin-dependent oxidoreductase n=1 Tax=Methylobacterium sp. E-016 TaxID=2836556 RepID=UPI001FBA809A|nr:molybdopterin-dependent oxidoreductase [Methylobacterium sp. E-016]MCJ2078853.1 molybdopterin-dependent oxidoreductase [Methylobacterium sp. E-016]
MIRPPSRRSILLGATGALGAGMLGGCDRLGEMAWFKRTLATGEDANHFVQRLLLTERTLAPEYAEADISPFFKPNGTEDPPDKAYKALARRKFAGFQLEMGGLVEKPFRISLADLRKLPPRTQITRHDCVEGWSCIGKWTDVPLSELLQPAVLKPNARYVVFHCADTMDQGEAAGAEDADDAEAPAANPNPNMARKAAGTGSAKGAGDPPDGAPAKDAGTTEPVRFYESIDLVDAYHPQTILAYEMNGQTLPVAHGAPLRLRLERNLGYKQAKYVMRIEVVEGFADIGEGKGGYWEDQGYAWYGGI